MATNTQFLDFLIVSIFLMQRNFWNFQIDESNISKCNTRIPLSLQDFHFSSRLVATDNQFLIFLTFQPILVNNSEQMAIETNDSHVAELNGNITGGNHHLRENS